MKAAVLHEAGGIPVAGQFDDPVAEAGEVVAEVVVAALNPIDRVLAGGGPMGPPTVPSVVGREGIVRLEDGSRAYFRDPRAPYGTMAELVPVEVARTFPVGDGVDDGVAVALGVSGLTAFGALRWRAKLDPGETVLVLGASGAVGQCAVQLAKAFGAGRVVAAARDAASLDRLREAGAADETVVLEGDYADALRAVSGGGYDVVVDPLFGPVAETLLPLVKPGGRYVMCGSMAGRSANIAYGALLGRALLGVGRAPDADQRSAYAELLELASKGQVVIETERVPLDQISEAWERQGSSPHRKLIIEP